MREVGEVEWIEDGLTPVDPLVPLTAFRRLCTAVIIMGVCLVIQGIAIFILLGDMT